jgi:hypothetical protein
VWEKVKRAKLLPIRPRMSAMFQIVPGRHKPVGERWRQGSQASPEDPNIVGRLREGEKGRGRAWVVKFQGDQGGRSGIFLPPCEGSGKSRISVTLS